MIFMFLQHVIFFIYILCMFTSIENLEYTKISVLSIYVNSSTFFYVFFFYIPHHGYYKRYLHCYGSIS